MLLPSKIKTTIKSVELAGKIIKEAFPPMSVVFTLEDDVDVSRGDMFVREFNCPQMSQNIELMVCWFNQKPLTEKASYTIRHTTKEAKCLIKEIRYKMNINTLHRNEKDKTISMNDFARIHIHTSESLFYDKYKLNKNTGSLIFIDEITNETVGAGMIL